MVENFRGLTAGFAHLLTISRTFIAGYICITKNIAIPNTRIFHFLFLLCDRETHFECCPILPSLPSNTKHSVDLPCTHDIPSNTKHSVDLYHALTPMSCDVLCINAMQCHCMLFHVTCRMILHGRHNPHHLPVSWTITSPAYDFHISFHSHSTCHSMIK